MVTYFFEDIKSFDASIYTEWLQTIIVGEDKKPGDLTFVFCSDDYLLNINKEFLQHDYYTDIITFDKVRGKTVSGEIFISLPRIYDNASILNLDYNRELLRVLSHGVLHLCGYADKTDKEIEIMRSKENFYIEKYVSRETMTND